MRVRSIVRFVRFVLIVLAAGTAQAQTGSITGTVYRDVNGNGVPDPQDKGLSQVSVVLLDESGALCDPPMIEPFGRYEIGYHERPNGGLTCSFNLFGAGSWGGLEDSNNQFLFYWDHAEQAATTEAALADCEGGTVGAERHRAQLWSVAQNQETGTQSVGQSQASDLFDTMLPTTRYNFPGSDIVQVLAEVDGVGNPQRFTIKVKQRQQDWDCEKWRNPEGDDFDIDASTVGCSLPNYPVYKNPFCWIASATTDENGAYSFAGLDDGAYIVSADALHSIDTAPDGSVTLNSVLIEQQEAVIIAGGDSVQLDFVVGLNIPALGRWGLLVLAATVLGASLYLLPRRRREISQP